MALHLDPADKGRYIKLGNRQWLKIDRITKATLIQDAGGKRIVIDHKDKKGAAKQLNYTGPLVDKVLAVLKKEGK